MLLGRKHSRVWDLRVSPVEYVQPDGRWGAQFRDAPFRLIPVARPSVRSVDIARRYRRHPSDVVRACTPSARVARSSPAVRVGEPKGAAAAIARKLAMPGSDGWMRVCVTGRTPE